ncbi:hypothetical protein EYF80_012981 [Liparis tanakae]|uniref:Uncharacterized protein n=1 Tax=Liparis tanakae TaxID=230148 RepID=A0A4Z2IHC6_9TELE|nr:hypothetical protein EYF80_012981 [Liparis tanakae]
MLDGEASHLATEQQEAEARRSPPMEGRRRYISTPMQIKANTVKSVTEKASEPGSTLNSSPLIRQ